jgi:hypothetical protein
MVEKVVFLEMNGGVDRETITEVDPIGWTGTGVT